MTLAFNLWTPELEIDEWHHTPTTAYHAARKLLADGHNLMISHYPNDADHQQSHPITLEALHTMMANHPQKIELDWCLTLSTAHLPDKELNPLDQTAIGVLAVGNYGDYWTAFCSTMEGDVDPEDHPAFPVYLGILSMAFKTYGARYVRFDPDGPIMPDLPVFNDDDPNGAA